MAVVGRAGMVRVARARARRRQLPELPQPVNVPWERVLPPLPGRAGRPAPRGAGVPRRQPRLRGARRGQAAAPVEAAGRRVRPPRDRLAGLPAHHRDAAQGPQPPAPALLPPQAVDGVRDHRLLELLLHGLRRLRARPAGARVLAPLLRHRPRAGTPTRCRTCCCSPTPTPSTTCRHTYASMGLRTPAGTSRKRDHDGVNEINVRAIPKIKAEIERRYDPTVRDVPGPLDEMGGLEPTKAWREGAWRNAERLTARARPGRPRPGGRPDRELVGGVGQADRLEPAGAGHPRRPGGLLPRAAALEAPAHPLAALHGQVACRGRRAGRPSRASRPRRSGGWGSGSASGPAPCGARPWPPRARPRTSRSGPGSSSGPRPS